MVDQGELATIALLALVVAIIYFRARGHAERSREAARAAGAPLARFCFSCAARIAADAANCRACNAVQPPAPRPRFCFACGLPLPLGAAVCAACAAVQISPAHPLPPSRSRLGAAFLALFLGDLGLHRFYLGRPQSGFVYLLFFWTFIPALIGFVEGVRLLAMSDAQFARDYP